MINDTFILDFTSLSQELVYEMAKLQFDSGIFFYLGLTDIVPTSENI